jgi:hypothetical protein
MKTIKNVAPTPVKTLRLPQENLDVFFQPSAQTEIHQEQNEENTEEVENSPVKVRPNAVKQQALLAKKVQNSQTLMAYESLLQSSSTSVEEKCIYLQKRSACLEEDILIGKQLKRLQQNARCQDQYRKKVIHVNLNHKIVEC